MDLIWIHLVLTFLPFAFSAIPPSIRHGERSQSHLDQSFEHNRILPSFILPRTKEGEDSSQISRQSLSKPVPLLRVKSPNEITTAPITNYDFEYQINGGGNFYGHSETRSGPRTNGEYFVILPDFRRQVVKYYVDGTGYHANVTYEPITPVDVTMLNVLSSRQTRARRRQFKKVVRKRIAKKLRSVEQPQNYQITQQLQF